MRLTLSQKNSLAKAAKDYSRNIDQAEEYLAGRGLSLAVARLAGLGVVNEPHEGHEGMVGRLAIPYITSSGVVDIRFRSIRGEEPKYLGLPGANLHMYNVRAIAAADTYICVCEGELDAITLQFAVGLMAVGLPGANSWKKHYRRILQDFEKIYVFADGDKAGNDFARHLAREVQGVVVVPMDEGEDVNSMYIKYGANYFKEKVKNDE